MSRTEEDAVGYFWSYLAIAHWQYSMLIRNVFKWALHKRQDGIIIKSAQVGDFLC